MADFPERPDYFTLRLAADLSSAIRGQTVWFNYGDEEGLAITGPGLAGAPPPPIPVSTPLSASSRPAVRSVTISVPEYGSITLAATTCSALFWSESAVEKFLLPYYVSAGGQQAYDVLHAINQTWYNFRVQTPVVALAFGYPSQNFATRSVQLWDTVCVISCQPSPNPPSGQVGVLVAQPLREFLASQDAPPQAEPLPDVPFAWGPATAPASTFATPIDSVGAREVAEYVSGLRGLPVDIYETSAPGGLDPMLTPVGNGPPLFTAWTRIVRERPPVSVALEVSMTFMGGQVVGSRDLTAIGGQPSNVPDSAFWTDGAVEMLVLPYYASVEGEGAPPYLMLILGKWSGMIPSSIIDAELLQAEVLEVMGRRLRNPVGIVQGTDAGQPAETGPFTSEVFALIHLPDSEWIDQTVTGPAPAVQSIFLENRTWLLSRTADQPLVSPRRRLVPRRRVTG